MSRIRKMFVILGVVCFSFSVAAESACWNYSHVIRLATGLHARGSFSIS